MFNSVLKKNIFANFFGTSWISILALVFVPFYIHFLGIEAYGLIGIFGMLYAMFAILDMGITPTINREMARLSGKANGAQQMRDLIRTIELIYWGIAVIIGIIVMTGASFIANKWLNATNLSIDTIQKAILIMGVCIVFRWPLSFYSGGLMGLQHQVLFNKINVIVSTFGRIITLLVLWLVSPTIIAFFLCQIFVSFVHTLSVALCLWRKIPGTGIHGRFDLNILTGIWRFAVGSGGSAVLGVILRQMDKIILSKILPLELFGYYNIASMLAMRLKSIYGPVTAAMYPHFSQLVLQKKHELLKDTYHRGCQFMSIIILPVAAIIAFFSRDVLLLWMQNPEIAEQAFLIVSILITGKALNGLMQLPYMMQLAHGWTSLGFYVNLFSAILLIPLTVFLATNYGPAGAASVWLILNIGYVLIGINIMHHKILPADKWIWYGQDVGLPMLVAFVVAGAWKLLFNDLSNSFYGLLSLTGVFVFSLFLTAYSTPFGRELISKYASITVLKTIQKKLLRNRK